MTRDGKRAKVVATADILKESIMIPMVAPSKLKIMPTSLHQRAAPVSVEYNIPSKTNNAHHTSGVTVESNPTAPAAATDDGARLGASDVPSTPAAAGGESSTPAGQDSHADGTPDETTKDSSAAHSDAAGTDGVVYKEKHELRAKADGRAWNIAKVFDNGYVHVTTPQVGKRGQLLTTKDHLKVLKTAIPTLYDHYPVTAQAEEKPLQAPASLSTRPAASPAVLSNSAKARASTAVTKLFIVPELSIPQWVEGDDQQDVGKWTFDRDTSMHLFWAVRRIPASTLALEHSVAIKRRIPNYSKIQLRTYGHQCDGNGRRYHWRQSGCGSPQVYAVWNHQHSEHPQRCGVVDEYPGAGSMIPDTTAQAACYLIPIPVSVRHLIPPHKRHDEHVLHTAFCLQSAVSRERETTIAQAA